LIVVPQADVDLDAPALVKAARRSP
jgi:hypothetical protein